MLKNRYILGLILCLNLLSLTALQGLEIGSFCKTSPGKLSVELANPCSCCQSLDVCPCGENQSSISFCKSRIKLDLFQSSTRLSKLEMAGASVRSTVQANKACFPENTAPQCAILSKNTSTSRNDLGLCTTVLLI